MQFQKFVGTEPRKVKAPKRPPGSILRRTDFKYMGGHGTFYRFDKKHFPRDLLSAKPNDRLSVVLYNLHTDQLDEVIFNFKSRSKIGENCFRLRGYIADIKECYQIKFRYFPDRPLESHILVYASAPPDYSFFTRPRA